MKPEDLQAKMLAFIEAQDGDYFDEWYATQRDYAATVLSDFATFLGVELVVPEYVPQRKKPEIDREKLMKALMPGIRDLFELEYKKMRDENT